MHGYARFRLVGGDAGDARCERAPDAIPGPLPFPTCVRDFPRRRGAAGARVHDALAALDEATLSFEKFLRVLEEERRRNELDGDGPRAA